MLHLTSKYITSEDVRRITGIKDTMKVSRLLRKWYEQGLLKKIDTGSKKTVKYKLSSSEMTDILFAEGK